MPQIIVLPHVEIGPVGSVIQTEKGVSSCVTLLNKHIDHACDRVCACSMSQVIVRKSYNNLNVAEENEED